MEEIVTLAALAVLLLGTHLAFAVYLYRSLLSERNGTERAHETATGSESVGVGDTSPSQAALEGQNTEGPSTLPCPTCGVPNDPSFQFCRRCVSDLSKHSTPKGGVAGRSGS